MKRLPFLYLFPKPKEKYNPILLFPSPNPESLEPLMMKALLRDKPEFVRILLQNGIVMRQFLTVERLSILYNKSVHRNAFERCLSQKGLRKLIKPKSATRKVEPQQQHEINTRSDARLTQVITNGKMLEAAPVYLSTVSRLVRKMIGRFSHRTYEQDTQV